MELSRTNKSILLVEDNPDDEILTFRALRKNKITNSVVVARDGAEALDYLFADGDHAGRDTGEQPELILLDLNLPRFSGHEVLTRIRSDERTRRIPVVILTSSAEESDILDSYNEGANSYIRKPVDFREFIDVIGQLGAYWLALNRSSVV